jgi:hypothetical protein
MSSDHQWPRLDHPYFTAEMQPSPSYSIATFLLLYYRGFRIVFDPSSQLLWFPLSHHIPEFLRKRPGLYSILTRTLPSLQTIFTLRNLILHDPQRVFRTCPYLCSIMSETPIFGPPLRTSSSYPIFCTGLKLT